MSRPARPDGTLTTRQLEIFTLVQRGWTDQQIAARLVVEVGTVRVVRGAILRRLGLRNRAELIARYGGAPCCPTCARLLPVVDEL